MKILVLGTGLQGKAALMQASEAAIVLLPPDVTVKTAAVAVANGCHWLDASYTRPEYQALSVEAAAKGLALLPEFGLDPGIDLVLAAEAVRELDEVHDFNSYGAGIPEPAAANNPLWN
jgi:saccharopine dehydrogenase-like NADP-dependent oxidoreductase